MSASSNIVFYYISYRKRVYSPILKVVKTKDTRTISTLFCKKTHEDLIK